MNEATFSAGIILNAIVCSIVASVALAFVMFLWRRWSNLTATLHAYSFIWFVTVIVWVGAAVRYFSIGLGFGYPLFNINERIIESAVFFTGPPLYYYLGVRLFNSKKIAEAMCVVNTLFGCVAIWFLFQPNGITFPIITPFSAEPSLNSMSLTIFSVLAGLAALMLAFDVGMRWYRRSRPNFSAGEGLYSLSILLYVLLGSVDQSKIFLDWPILSLHILYCAVFLFGYLLVASEESRNEQYLVTEQSVSPFATK